MKQKAKFVLGEAMPLIDRFFQAAARHNALLLLGAVCCGVAVVGVFVVHDLQAANAEVQRIYSTSVRGLERIGELQYEAQETRRATLYALTTADSNLQVEYADQTRDADRHVRDGIEEYRREANRPEESAMAARLSRDWIAYLEVRDEVLASILEGSTQEAVARDIAGGVPAFERVRSDLDQVKRLYAEEASRSQANLAASSRRSILKMIGILSFTFLLSTAAVWAIQRSHMLSRMQLAELQMEFVASVSHELRTPLAVIRSAADNIADGLVQNQTALLKYGAVLQRQSRSMGELVDQILLFASTEDRTRRTVVQPLAVAEVVNAAVHDTHTMIADAKFALDIEMATGLPPVMADLESITQCLRNLIGNAVKYGGSDQRVLLRATSAPAKSELAAEVRISIVDHGIGIESSELERIFDPFYRSPRVQVAQIHGTGLGLALAKRLAESMGGRLTVTSQLGSGSTFTLHLQIAQGENMQIGANDSRQSRVSLI